MSDPTPPARPIADLSADLAARAAAPAQSTALPAAAEPEELRRDLPPAALRALAEAEERRRSAAAAALPLELGGRDGPEPVRYGDYEKNGLAVDF